MRTSPPATTRPIVTTPQGGPAVVEFSAPTAYSCLQGSNRGEAQVTIGWSVPSATEVILTLDGATLASGISDTLPYQVLAGAPSEVGSTVVFACDPIREHTITISWRMNGAPTTERVVAVIKEPTS